MATTTLTPSTDATGAPPAVRRSWTRAVADGNARMYRASPLNYLVLVVTMILSVFPLYWTLVMSSRTNDQIASNPPPFTPGPHLQANLDKLFANQDVLFARALLNSFFVSGVITVSVVAFCTLAGFAFAKLRFRGRNAALLMVVATMMVPVQLATIPLYMLMNKLHLQGSLWSVTLPFLVSGFGVFIMRQYTLQSVPDELVEAARIDGCSTFRIYRSVVLPAVRPAAAVLGLFTFMQYWNDFLWPYVALSDPQTSTVQVALSRLSGGYYTDQSLVMAGTFMATLPLLVVMFVFGRQLISGIMEGAVKA